MQKRPLIILTGPTAVGKTKASIGLAKALDGEIISADSMQVYKEMNIGSAKIRPDEMEGVKHYLIDLLNPDEEFHVVRFQELAKQALKEIYAKGKIPIVVGGTGFYIQALLYDIDFAESKEDTEYRRELETLAREQGNEALHNLLCKVDPPSAKVIHANNVKRVIRALEFYKQTGKKISEHNETEHAKSSPYDFCYFVLTDERSRLYERIDRRIDRMLQEGLVAEVQSLKEKGYTRDMVSMQGLGYKEILDYINGQITLEEAIYILKRDTRHFANRQLTWFRRARDVMWIDKSEYGHDEERILNVMLSYIRERTDIL